MQPDSSRRTRLVQLALLAMAITACSGAPQPGTTRHEPAPDSTPPRTASASFAGEPVDTLNSDPAGASPGDTGGPAPASTRQINGYFNNATTRNSMRFWKGPNDREGFERLTRFTVEVDGAPEYSRAVSTVQLVGVCRSQGLGLDQLLLSFHPERRGGAALGVLRYDTENRRFVLGYSRRDARFDCAGGRALFPEGATALPCTCPWGDGPDDPSGTRPAAAPADARDILILPAESGGPAFTRGETPDGSISSN